MGFFNTKKMTLQKKNSLNGLDGTTTVSISHNKKFDSIEIDFNGKKPVELVRNWLKKNCFRWNPATKNWYIPFTSERFDNIHFIFSNRTFETEDLEEVTPKTDPKNTKVEPKTYPKDTKIEPKKRQIATQTKLDIKQHNPLLDAKKENDARNHESLSSVTQTYEKTPKKVISARELSKKKFQEYEFKGKYLQLMGKPSEGFRMMLHGMPGGGKTTFLLQFSKYLCNNFGNVLYVSQEEFGSSTLTNKINKYLKPIPHNIDFSEDVKGINLNKYNFVVLDSINDLGMDLKAFKELKAKYPKTAFILIMQCTKAGTFKGGKEWEHEVEIGAAIKEQGVISVYKNRFDVKGELNFFEK